MKLKRGNLYFFLFSIIFILEYVEAAPIGVTPAGYDVNFEPGLSQVFSFYFGIDDTSAKYEVYVLGDLSDYVKISRDELNGPGNVNVLLQLPDKIEKPGVHRIRVGINKIGGGQQGAISVVASVVGVIDVRVPYPGKYAEIQFSATNANVGEPVEFKLTISSLGHETILADSRVELYDSRGKKVDTIDMGTNEISSTETREIVKNVDTKNYAAGSYKAVAVVDYGGEKPASAEADFRLGELFVDIVNHTKEFERGKINKMDIQIESHWNDPIENVYGEVFILGYNIPSFLTPSVNLDKFGKAILTGYFDTTTIDKNKFQAKVVLRYKGKTTEKTVDLRFKREVNKLAVGIMIVSLLIVIVLILLIIINRRRRKEAREDVIKRIIGKNEKKKKK
ncbi:hypothetical protein HYV50_00695 [Candidatus Pacearchaeota archaeon]|nr:hypothetical protein [Candidatus Pacearchaeota archaeon]